MYICYRTCPFCTQYSHQASLLDRFGGSPPYCVWCTPPRCSLPTAFGLVHYTCGWSHLLDPAHAYCGASKTPIKSGHFGHVSQSLALESSTPLKSLAVTFYATCIAPAGQLVTSLVWVPFVIQCSSLVPYALVQCHIIAPYKFAA